MNKGNDVLIIGKLNDYLVWFLSDSKQRNRLKDRVPARVKLLIFMELQNEYKLFIIFLNKIISAANIHF